MTPPTSSGFGTTMRTSRKSYSRKTLTHVSPGSMISSSTSDSDNSLHSLYFTSYHGLINYPQKIPAGGGRLRLPQPRRNRPQTLMLRRPGLLAADEAVVAGPLHGVAHDHRRPGASVRSGADHCAVEREPRRSPDGAGLATRGLRRGPARGIGPGQPRRRVRKDCGAVLLQRHQVIQDIAPGVEAGGNQARQHTGNVSAVLGAIKQRVLALSDEEFQCSLHHIVLGARFSWGRAGIATKMRYA